MLFSWTTVAGNEARIFQPFLERRLPGFLLDGEALPCSPRHTSRTHHTNRRFQHLRLCYRISHTQRITTCKTNFRPFTLNDTYLTIKDSDISCISIHTHTELRAVVDNLPSFSHNTKTMCYIRNIGTHCTLIQCYSQR